MTYETTYKKDLGSYFVIGGPVRNTKYKEEFPAIFVHPKEWNGRVVVLVSDEGKSALFDDQGKLNSLVSELTDNGVSVVGADLIFQGEFNEGQAPTETRRVKNPREAAAYTFGYNHSVFSQRTHDLVNLLTLLANHDRKPTSITLVGQGKTGAICAAATTIDTNVAQIVLEQPAKTALNVTQIHAPYFLPGSAKYGGLEGMLDASGVKTTMLESLKPKQIYSLLK